MEILLFVSMIFNLLLTIMGVMSIEISKKNKQTDQNVGGNVFLFIGLFNLIVSYFCYMYITTKKF